jgi:hypothetical protein
MNNKRFETSRQSTSNVLHWPSGTHNKKTGSQSGEANPQACVRITVLPRDARARRRRDEEVSERYQSVSPGRGSTRMAEAPRSRVYVIGRLRSAVQQTGYQNAPSHRGTPGRPSGGYMETASAAVMDGLQLPLMQPGNNAPISQ